MGLFGADYSTSYNGHEIAVSLGTEGAKATQTRIKLYIDGRVVDETTGHALAGVFGCNLTLRGSLETGELVTYTLVASILRRPLHTISVNGKQVFQQKGTWGGA